MGRISDRFLQLRETGERALVPFVTAGDPDLATTAELVVAMVEAGADAIELGVPFSDPIADGPTIQRASERSLAGGTTLRRILGLVKQLRPQVKIPLLLMGYANPFYALGVDGLVGEAAAAGVDGIICPDLPPEEGADLYGALEKAGIDGVLLAAPTTTPARLALLVERTRGFLYCVSLTGVTGARATVAQGVEASVRAARALRDVPVCVGFGVSTPAHAAEIGRYADGVVVGGAIVDRIERASSRDEAVSAVSRFVAELKAPLRAASR
jgi:tryptophan synthase alpha chain